MAIPNTRSRLLTWPLNNTSYRMPAFLLLLLFTVLAILFLRRLVPRDTLGLTNMQLALGFCLKVLMGCAYGYIFLVKYDGDDTWWLHEFSLKQTALLKSDPLRFISEMNPVLTFGNDNSFSLNSYYYVSYLEAWLLAKPMALFNLVSGGNYYVNIVFFNLPLFFGHYWLFRMMREKFDAPPLPLYAAVFLVPPVVFWLSGFRADGLLFLLVMMALRHVDRLLKKVNFKSLLVLGFSLAGILILRSVVLVAMLPAMLSWILVVKSRRSTPVVFLAVYSACLVLFVMTTLVSPEKNAASVIAGRQQAFFELEGNTRFKLDSLGPDAISFVRVLPQALNNSFLRPYPWEASGALQYATVLETMLLLLLVALLIFIPNARRRHILMDPFALALICFGLFLYTITGYIVPFPGAIVRYKIIGELFFFTVIVSAIEWNRIINRNQHKRIKENKNI